MRAAAAALAAMLALAGCAHEEKGVAVPAAPANAVLATLQLAPGAAPVRFSYSAEFANPGSAPATIVWRLTLQGTRVLDSGVIELAPGGSTRLERETSSPAAQAGLVAFIADTAAAGSAPPQARAIALELLGTP